MTIQPARLLPRPKSADRINKRLIARLQRSFKMTPGMERPIDGRNWEGTLVRSRREPDEMLWFDGSNGSTPFFYAGLPPRQGVYASVRLPLWLPGKKPKRLVVNVKSNLEGRVWWRDWGNMGTPFKNIFGFSSWRDDRLHCDHGPAIYDGTKALYALNGIEVPEWLVTTPAARLNPAQFTSIHNAEVRREFVRKVGIERIIQKCRAKTLDKQGDYELLALPVRTDGTSWQPNGTGWWSSSSEWRYLKMRNPSIGVWHVEGVPNTISTVQEALTWREPEALQRIPRSENGQDYWQQGDVYIWPSAAKFLKPRPSIIT